MTDKDLRFGATPLAQPATLLFGAPDSSPTDLLFQAPALTQPALLLFGGQDTPTDTTHDAVVALDATLPLPTVAVGVSNVYVAALAAALPNPVVAVGILNVEPATLNAALPGLTVGMTLYPVADLALLAALPVSTVAISFVPVAALDVQVALPGLGVAAVVRYASDTDRPLVGQSANRWQGAAGVEAGLSERCRRMAALPVGGADKSQFAQPMQSNILSRLPSRLRGTLHNSAHVQHDAAARRTGMQARYRELAHLCPATGSRSQEGRATAAGLHAGWQDRQRRQRYCASRFAEAAPVRRTWRDLAGAARHVAASRAGRYQEAGRPRPGISKVVVPPTPWNPCYLPPAGSAVHLLFKDGTADSNLVFICERHAAPVTTIVIPVKRTYIVLNHVQLRRVDGNHILPATSLALNIDWDSWTWSFNAALPASALPLVEPGNAGDPVVLEATINGAPYLLLAEQIQRDRSFGKSSIAVSGRGKSAMLSDPYSPILTFNNATDKTAQQLMNDALTVNGAPLGWAIDWRIDDWLVPAGAWNHQGSYMSALCAIAAAAGAFIQPDPVNQILRVRPRYPVKPWEWAGATPEIQLPSAVVVKEGITWTDKPAYNAVYISGATAGGVLGYVKRTGSAGDVLAPMITDPLITDAVAARQRGIATLADTGRTATYSLSQPVLPETGIIQPGTLVRYVDTGTVMGVVKGVSVNAEQTRVRQTIEVQTHG